MTARAPHSGQLMQMLARFASLAFCRADILLELDGSLKILFAAGTTDRLIGVKERELIGTSVEGLIDPRDRNMIKALLETAVSKGRVDDVYTRLTSRNGMVSDAVVAGYSAPDLDGNFVLAIKVKPRATHNPHRHGADREEGSGLLEQEAFADVATERVQSIKDAGGDPRLTMVQLAGLDGSVADLDTEQQTRLMGEIGDIISSFSLGDETAGRVGEDAFGIVHDGNIDLDALESRLASATEAFGDDVKAEYKAATVSADPKGLSEQQVAKTILYAMQQFCDSPEALKGASITQLLEKQMKETAKLIEVFKRTCNTLDFRLVFMPICGLADGKAHHVEALTRFDNITGIEGSPFKMITLAEEVGLIADFDLAVVHKALDTINDYRYSGRLLPIAVNISGNSIQKEGFVEDLLGALAKHKSLAQHLTFEITESAKIEDLDGVNHQIQKLRRQGYKVALDDFGAGAASFDYLNSFEVDTVKFDGPVVKRAYQTEKGQAFLKSMATLCNDTGIETIAEMVEDKELADFLKGCGIHLGQGWYFGKPGDTPVAPE